MNRLNRHCAYFPCHKGLEDCTFCYCPFYPCRDSRLGEYVTTKDKKRIWSCQHCSWIHKRRVVDRIYSIITGLEKTGVVILGHGSKLKKANDTVRKAAKAIMAREKGLRAVEPAYLQFARPNLKDAVEKLLKKGCNKIIVAPFFLFSGNHVSKDIPKAIKKQADRHKGIKFIYSKSIGSDSRINDIVADSIREAIR